MDVPILETELMPGCQINAEAGLSNAAHHSALVEVDSLSPLRLVRDHVFDLPSCMGLDEFSLCWQNVPEVAVPGCRTLRQMWQTGLGCFLGGGVELKAHDTVGLQQLRQVVVLHHDGAAYSGRVFHSH